MPNTIISTAPDSIHVDSRKMVHLHGGYNMAAGTSSLWDRPLPAVRYATYNLYFSWNLHPIVRNFFYAVGQQLHTIQLCQIQAIEDTDLLFLMERTIPQMREHCDALEQVNLLLQSWQMLWVYIPVLPAKVSKIVVRILRAQLARTAAYQLFTATLSEYKARNLQLRTVQFYSGSNIQCLRVHPRVLVEGLAHMRNIGLTVLDDEGNILQP